MNIASKLCTIRHSSLTRNFHRKFQISSIKYESTQAAQPVIQEEKFDFEDLKVFERTERRKAKIPSFMKNIFISDFNRELLSFPEIINKEESESLENRIQAIEKVFKNSEKTKDDRIEALKQTRMYAAPVALTKNGLALNHTESLRYLEAIASDFQLGQELSDHWVSLEALKLGFTDEQYNGVIDDLTTGENTVSLCIKERVAERVSQADFRTSAEMDGQGVWHITGEKVAQKADGYLLVLTTVEASRLKAFLVHPGAAGVTSNGGFVTFFNTPATPLDMVTEARLAQIFGTSRLHAAALSRCRLQRAVDTVVEYVTPRAFGGQPLSDYSIIRNNIGNAIVNIYASESAEYFTAGLLDGYIEPDAELEVAMCRNFIAHHGLTSILNLLTIPALDKEQECKQLFDDMRHLTTRGESLDSINMFIALNGIHHAGKMMSEEIKKVRNPLMNPSFIFKKVLSNRHQEKDDPKLTLYLAEHLHPSLKPPSEQLEYCVLRMRFACETLMARHGVKVASAYTELNRLAEAATEILVMTAVLARASRSYCIGLRNAELEMKLAACFVEKSKDRVKKLIKEIDDGKYINLDHFNEQFGKRVLENTNGIPEKPTARTFW